MYLFKVFEECLRNSVLLAGSSLNVLLAAEI